MGTSLTMQYTDENGNDISRTYGAINPDAPTEILSDFAQGLNDLTTNTYGRSLRTSKHWCESESLSPHYTLPTASESRLGGVKIGDGLSMVGDYLNVTLDAQPNVIENIAVDGTIQPITDKTVNLGLSAYVKRSELAGVYTYKGKVNSASDLPNNPNVGDVYNISIAGGSDVDGIPFKAGDNAAWNGSGWDNFAGIVDLSSFVEKDGNKVLSTNDFSDADKSKLDGLANYSLPTASTTQKGGVIIGTGLAMNGDSLNCTISGSSYTLPTATTSTKGGVVIGSGLAMSGDTLNVTIGGGGEIILPTVSSTVNGAIWITS